MAEEDKERREKGRELIGREVRRKKKQNMCTGFWDEPSVVDHFSIFNDPIWNLDQCSQRENKVIGYFCERDSRFHLIDEKFIFISSERALVK